MKAVIYARYSSDSQREESIEGQIRECTEYANRYCSGRTAKAEVHEGTDRKLDQPVQIW